MTRTVVALTAALVPVLAVAAGRPAVAADPAYGPELQAWRAARERKLRADDGWLTLAGRFVLKAGANTFGPGPANDIVFPPELKGAGPDRLGTLLVGADGNGVVLRPAPGAAFTAGGRPVAGDRPFATDRPDWVGLGRVRMHVIVRDGRFVLRLADNESRVREDFPGCVWYPADERFKVAATFVPYPAGRTIRVVNVLGRAADEPSPGYAEFELAGRPFRLDAVAEGAGLLFVFKDKTAGDTTYAAARFLTVEARPRDHAAFPLDFNRAYNPPCAVSAFTTCPTAPRQNALPVRVEAGEKYAKR